MRKLLTVTVGMAVAATLIAGCSNDVKAHDAHLSKADLEYLQRDADVIAMQYGISDPPEVEIERVISLSEWGPTQVSCLQEAGFSVKETPDGEGIDLSGASDPALTDSLALTRYTCEVKYPVDPKYMRPLTQDQIVALYEYRTGDLLTCLAGMGYPVSQKPPSQMVFIQSLGDWNPYSYVSIPQDEMKKVTHTCPQVDMSIYDLS